MVLLHAGTTQENGEKKSKTSLKGRSQEEGPRSWAEGMGWKFFFLKRKHRKGEEPMV